MSCSAGSSLTRFVFTKSPDYIKRPGGQIDLYHTGLCEHILWFSHSDETAEHTLFRMCLHW
jgi:hypothetical protein